MEVLRPRTVGEALRYFEKNPHATPLAGGTDFMVGWNMGLLNGRTILDLSRLNDWRRISKPNGAFRIGALVTHTQIQEHSQIRKEFSLLVRACSEIGGVAIQNRGTLGGNIANASPAGDTFPPLAVYGARVHTVSPRGKRTLPLLEVFAGVKKTNLGLSELIAAIELPPLSKRPTRQIFRKVGTRAAQALSKVVAAGLLWKDKAGRIEELRFALGSVATTVRRLTKVESYVRNRKITQETLQQVREILAEEISPINDVRSTAEYRLRVSQNLLSSFLTS